jgi:hypothetical protein
MNDAMTYQVEAELQRAQGRDGDDEEQVGCDVAAEMAYKRSHD